MHPSGWLWFFTYPLNIFMSYSNEYIYLKKTGPHSLISLTKWTIRCTMISKNEGEKYISSWHNVTTIFFCNSSSFSGSITLLHTALKKKHSWVMTWRTCFRSIERIATDNNCYINAWQWDFKPTSFNSFIDTRLWIFDE